jgi:hypothetical protein
LIPFTQQAIRLHVHRGTFRENVHFFRVGRRVVFKWSAVSAWIEGRTPPSEADGFDASKPADIVPVRRRA